MNRKALSEQCARSRLLDVALSIPRARFNVDVSSVAPRRRRRCIRFVTTPVAREETTARNGKAARRRRRRRRFVTTPVAREETTARNGEAG
ncbi:unnamed protein product, partial [Brassica oleracea]